MYGRLVNVSGGGDENVLKTKRLTTRRRLRRQEKQRVVQYFNPNRRVANILEIVKPYGRRSILCINYKTDNIFISIRGRVRRYCK